MSKTGQTPQPEMPVNTKNDQLPQADGNNTATPNYIPLEMQPQAAGAPTQPATAANAANAGTTPGDQPAGPAAAPGPAPNRQTADPNAQLAAQNVNNPAPAAATPASSPQMAGPQPKPYMSFNPPAISWPTPIPGITYDFNRGVRAVIPQGDYRVRFIDQDACVTVYDAKASGCIVSSSKFYFVNFRLEIYEKDKLIFEHNYDARDKNVLIKFPDAAMGDVLAWFPYAEEFRKKHGCKLFCAMNKKFSSILEKGYPEITFVDTEVVPDHLYATYYMGLFAPWDNRDLQPVDWRTVGLQRHAAYLLGVDPIEIKPKLLASTKERLIKEPYVCVAAQATAQCKYWNNAYGWLGTVDYLKKLGYRVLCIDRDRIFINGNQGNSIPYGSEDFTGDRPLQERVDLLAHADFFIGLPSGLSWLAWGTGTPVIMIAGFSAPGTEFYTPYRVQHFHTCNSCCNDMRIEHRYGDFGACPRFRGTDREYECTRFITPEYVNKMIDKVRRDLGLVKEAEPAETKADPSTETTPRT